MRVARWLRSTVGQLVAVFALAAVIWCAVVLVVDYRSTVDTLVAASNPEHVLGGEPDALAWRHAIQQVSLTIAAAITITVLATFLMRQRFLMPLRRLRRTIERGADVNDISIVEHSQHDVELTRLTNQIAAIIEQRDQSQLDLDRSQLSLEQLYQFAPAAIVSIGPDGAIVAANRRAAELLGAGVERDMTGAALLDWIRDEDRGRFRQSIDRLDLERQCQADFRMQLGDEVRDVSLALAGLYDEHHALTQVRICMTDVSESRQLIRQISDQQRLMDLVINHMSDAILLIGADGLIITANQSLCGLLHMRVESLIGQPYNPSAFWTSLDLLDAPPSLQHLDEIAADLTQRCHERFDARDGTYRFQIAPVRDQIGEAVAQLWVVQDVTADVRSRQMLDQQAEQLQVMDQIGRQLHHVDGIDDLLMRSVKGLHEVMGVECVGLCLRMRDDQRRNRQIIHDGSDQMLMEAGSLLSRAIAKRIMPQVLQRGQTMLWTELDNASPWQAVLQRASLDTMAATVLFSRTGAEGMFWIARRGGETITPHQRFLLEAMAPILSSAMENAQLRDLMRQLQLTDPVTELPNFHQFELLLHQRGRDLGSAWVLVLIDVMLLRDAAGASDTFALNRQARRTAEQLRTICRTTDELARIDDSKFALLCPNCTAEEGIGLVDRLRGSLAALAVDTAPGAEAGTACAIGSACYPDDDDDPNLLMHLAWQRMHQAMMEANEQVASVSSTGA